MAEKLTLVVSEQSVDIEPFLSRIGDFRHYNWCMVCHKLFSYVVRVTSNARTPELRVCPDCQLSDDEPILPEDVKYLYVCIAGVWSHGIPLIMTDHKQYDRTFTIEDCLDYVSSDVIEDYIIL